MVSESESFSFLDSLQDSLQGASVGKSLSESWGTQGFSWRRHLAGFWCCRVWMTGRDVVREGPALCSLLLILPELTSSSQKSIK